MRIALCTVQVPFIRGGAEDLCDNLYNELIKRNYDVEYIKIPFKWYPPHEIINNCLIWRLLDLTESNGTKIDGVIATKFPSYLVRHQNKVVWLLHQHRTAYNLAFTEFDDLTPYGKIGETVRNKIYKIDEMGMKEQKKYTQLQTRFLTDYGNIIRYGGTFYIHHHHCLVNINTITMRIIYFIQVVWTQSKDKISS